MILIPRALPEPVLPNRLAFEGKAFTERESTNGRIPTDTFPYS
jgi:hypothetical protein